MTNQLRALIEFCGTCIHRYEHTCEQHKSCTSCQMYDNVSHDTIDGGKTNCKCNAVLDKSQCPYYERF